MTSEIAVGATAGGAAAAAVEIVPGYPPVLNHPEIVETVATHPSCCSTKMLCRSVLLCMPRSQSLGS